MGLRLPDLILSEVGLPLYSYPIAISLARLKDSFNEWCMKDPDLRLAVVITDLQSHIFSYSPPPPEETAMVLQRMIMDIVAMVAKACKTFHRHPSRRCRVVTLSGYYTQKDSAIDHKRIETLEVAQEAIEVMVQPHLLNSSLAPLMSVDIRKLFPISAKDPGASLKWILCQEMRAALAQACPEA